MSLRERVEAGAEQDVLADALVNEQILHEPGAGDDGRPVTTGTDRMHVRPVAPIGRGICERQTDLVVDQMRRGIELRMQGAPERGPHCTAVGRVHPDPSRFLIATSTCLASMRGL